MMEFNNIFKLNDEQISFLERLYNTSKDTLFQMSEEELSNLLFPEGDSPLWDAMLDFDEKYRPLPDTLLAEQICDILRPPNLYNPQDEPVQLQNDEAV